MYISCCFKMMMMRRVNIGNLMRHGTRLWLVDVCLVECWLR